MNEQLIELIDRANIIELVNRFGMSIDLRQWEMMKSLFLNPTEFDYSSIGVASGLMSPEAIVDTARHDLSGFEATQHLISNHQVSLAGDSATCQAHVRAMHYLPNDQSASVFEMGGHYMVKLIRAESDWKIQHWKFTFLWSLGNSTLFELARNK
jgi:hypothetical protein